MRTIRHYTWTSIIVFAISGIGCTRGGGDTQKLSLTLPSRTLSHALGATPTTSPPLQTLIANVQIPGSPTMALQKDYGSSNPAPSDITLTFDNVPNGGTVLVQVLAVYSASGGAMQLKYGDVSTPINGDTTVDVSLTNAGGITKQSYIAGRYALPGPIYPTGTLIAMFQPPGAKPKMIVNQAAILSGWFNVFAVNGTGITFDYYWKEGQTNIFTGLNPDLSATACTVGETSGACPFKPSSDHVKIHKPSSYSHSGNSSDTTLQSNSEVEYVLGFFGNLEGTGKQVCYGNDIHEALPRLFAATDLATVLWQTPMDIDLTTTGTGTLTNVAEYMGGGAGFGQSSLYTGGSSCGPSSISNGTALILNHTLMGNSDENYGGFNVPWMMTQPFASNQNQYLTVVPVANNGTVATYSSAATSISVSGLAAAPVIGDAVSGPNIIMGTLITAVTGTGPYTLTIDHGMQNSGTGTPVSVSPNLTVSWQTLPGMNSMLASLPLTVGSTSANHVYMTGQPIPSAGSYVSGPEFTGNVTLSSIVQETANPGFYDFTFSQAPTSTSGSLMFTPFSGIELWAKFNVNIQGTTTNGSATVTAVAPAYMQNLMVGMAVFGTGIPAGATVASVVDTTAFTLSAPATGTGTTNMNIGNTNTNGGNDCTKLSSSGYQLAQTVSPTMSSVTFTGLPNLPPGQNVSYQFAVCAAQQQTVGKTYFGSYIQGQQNMLGGDNSQQPFGWAPATAVYSGGSTLPITSYLLQSAAAGGQGITTLQVSPTISGINPGDEILVTVNGMGAQGSCGPNAMMGNYAFARVLFSSGTTLQIPSGTWIDSFLTVPGAVLAATATPNANFCSIQITNVLQYRTMTVSGSASPAIDSFNYAAGNLGMVPIRINGTLTLNGVLLANSEGYTGGSGIGARYGASTAGATNSTAQTANGGGIGTNSGGGGGGVGNGDSGTNATGGGGNMANFGFSLMMGGGGGGGGSSPDSGGTGGGAMYIAANNLVLTSASTISADGAPIATGNGGAGGGGSVNLIANNITSAGAVTLTVAAVGGSESGGGNGGAGGGGFATVLACSTNANVTLVENVTAGTGTAHATPATNGYQFSDLNGVGTMTNSKYWCN